ncbi:hypothetical protein B0T10DRAFT_83478 [Thelonectria olida]|uniref:F-box domain-containing protein n=1 Tax=Thelonectria olida TaxID=1576542 RepID=A0A9P8W2Q4_9HYPO|nr:hypothetical protein B0T10DRAFT_83478 [Thelonectria olida]
MAAVSLRRIMQQRISGEIPGSRPADIETGDISSVATNQAEDGDTPPSNYGRLARSTDECNMQGLTNLIALSGRYDRPAASLNALGRLLELPMELQVMVLRYLNFGDLERLRRTCHFFRNKITKPMIRSLFPSLKYELLSTCYQCLGYDPLHGRMVRAEDTDERYPFANKCVDCIIDGPGFMVGRKVTMGDLRTLWVCRWCGYPVANDAAWNQPEFHYRCYRTFHQILFQFFVAGCVQWVFVIVGSALCWAYFRRETQVLAPTIVNFFMSIWAFLLTVVRDECMRTYHFTLFLEVAILSLWVPPLRTVIQHGAASSGGFSKSDIATLSFIAFNMFFRLLNALGNMILLCELKLWRRRRPNLPLWHRILYKVVAVLALWTYPQSVEQIYPGSWWFRRRGRRDRPLPTP